MQRRQVPSRPEDGAGADFPAPASAPPYRHQWPPGNEAAWKEPSPMHGIFQRSLAKDFACLIAWGVGNSGGRLRIWLSIPACRASNGYSITAPCIRTITGGADDFTVLKVGKALGKSFSAHGAGNSLEDPGLLRHRLWGFLHIKHLVIIPIHEPRQPFVLGFLRCRAQDKAERFSVRNGGKRRRRFSPVD